MADFKKTLGKKLASPKKDLRALYKKRDQAVLQKVYDNREKQSTSGAGGKTIFNTDRLDEFGIKEFKPTKLGDYYFNVLPLSFSEDIPYFLEISRHPGVGMSNDDFICMQRYTNGAQKCHRCTIQNEGWKKYGKNAEPSIKKRLVSMYPNDRVLYLIYDETAKYLDNKEPEMLLQIWNAPKKTAHGGIQSQVRDKKTGRILDISDISDGEDSQGRIIYMNTAIKEDKENNAKYPQYGSFDLLDRDIPIPDDILEVLDSLITTATKEGKNPIEYLLHFPTQDEIKESMDTENFMDVALTTTKGAKSDNFETEFGMDLDALQNWLNDAPMFKIKKWVRDHELTDKIDFDVDKDELIEAILLCCAEEV